MFLLLTQLASLFWMSVLPHGQRETWPLGWSSHKFVWRHGGTGTFVSGTNLALCLRVGFEGNGHSFMTSAGD